jgi:hypothetical protein
MNNARSRRELRELRAEFEPYIREVVRRISYLGSDDEGEPDDVMPEIFEDDDRGFQDFFFDDSSSEEEEESEPDEVIFVNPIDFINLIQVQDDESDDDEMDSKYSQIIYQVVEPQEYEQRNAKKRKRSNVTSSRTETVTNSSGTTTTRVTTSSNGDTVFTQVRTSHV